MTQRISEHELKAHMDGVLRTLDWSDTDARDAYTALTNETFRARHWEHMNADRIHALETQQADLIRQVKEVAAQRDEVKAALDASDDQHREALVTIKALADALWRSGRVVSGNDDGTWHSRHCPQWLPPAAAPCTCTAERAALRLAGRKP